jgi:predicted RNA-binding Zn-ribbon protein involved in translation (DUF1610 family)
MQAGQDSRKPYDSVAPLIFARLFYVTFLLILPVEVLLSLLGASEPWFGAAFISMALLAVFFLIFAVLSPCPKCGEPFLYDIHRFRYWQPLNPSQVTCSNCGYELQRPPTGDVGRRRRSYD